MGDGAAGAIIPTAAEAPRGAVRETVAITRATFQLLLPEDPRIMLAAAAGVITTIPDTTEAVRTRVTLTQGQPSPSWPMKRKKNLPAVSFVFPPSFISLVFFLNTQDGVA